MRSVFFAARYVKCNSYRCLGTIAISTNSLTPFRQLHVGCQEQGMAQLIVTRPRFLLPWYKAIYASCSSTMHIQVKMGLLLLSPKRRKGTSLCTSSVWSTCFTCYIMCGRRGPHHKKRTANCKNQVCTNSMEMLSFPPQQCITMLYQKCPES